MLPLRGLAGSFTLSLVVGASRRVVPKPSRHRKARAAEREHELPRYSLQAQQSMHLPQHEPAVAGQPQLHGQQPLPQQQVDFVGVPAMVVMMVSVRNWVDVVQSYGGVRRR